MYLTMSAPMPHPPHATPTYGRLDAIDGVRVFDCPKYGDRRGFFSETYHKQKWAEQFGVVADFIQDNQSLSGPAGTVRGLHFQQGHLAQAKLVRVTRGRVLDVAVDLRPGSPTYGHHVAAELSAENWRQIFVPRGFAHGFATLVPDTEVCYKVDNLYAPDAEGGVLWNDPALHIDWQLPAGVEPVLSDKDQVLPPLADVGQPF